MSNTISQQSFRRTRHWLAAAVASLCAMGCLATPGDGGASDEPVAQTSAAILNGAHLASEDYTGIVALQIWNTSAGPAHWTTFCSGGLMTNRVLLTAKHCLTGWPADSLTVYAKMGNQRAPVNGAWTLHPSLDIAVATLWYPMTMWNYKYDHFLTNPPSKTLTDYARTIYPGTNQSLNNSSVMCFGYGGNSTATPAPALTYWPFTTKFHGDNAAPQSEIHMPIANNHICEGGDSGMFCLSGASPYQSPLAVIFTDYYPRVAVPMCSGPGAETWAAWVTWMVAYS